MMQLNAKIQAKQQEELAQLKRQRADLDMCLMNNQMHSNEESAERAENKCRTAIKSMSLLAASHEHALKGFADKSHKQHQALRKAQVDSGHYRSPRRPDKLLTFAFLIVVAALEGLMIALNIMAEGNGGLLTSFALGMLSGLLTAANGCACGFSSRWFGYGLAKSTSNSGDAFKRGFSKAVCLITAALGFFIIFAAARTRSNGGSHHDIFSFHETGFFETFNDGLNLMTFTIGLLGLSAYEKKIEEAEMQRIELVEKLENPSRRDNSFEHLFELAMQFVAKPCKLWASGRLDLRQIVLRLVFSDYLVYCREKGFLNSNLSMPFNILRGNLGMVLQNGAAGEI